MHPPTPYVTSRRNDPRARPVPRDVWTLDNGTTLLVVAATHTHVLADFADAPSRFVTLSAFRDLIAYATLTTDGASIPAMLETLSEVEHEAMLAVSDTLADLELGAPGACGWVPGGMSIAYLVRDGHLVVYAYADGTGSARLIVGDLCVRRVDGHTPRAAVEALLAEVSRG